AESAKGNFSAEGTPQDYRFELTAEGVQGPNIPKGRWTLSGQGSDQAVRDVKLIGDVLEGRLETAADATWTPAVGWRATVSGQGLNPGAHWKDVPGKLNFQLKTDGGIENNALRANLLLEQLNGALSGQRVSGAADLGLQGQNLTVRTLRLNAGEARLEASGALAERWDLNWKLDVPQLKSLAPGVSGTVASAGTLTGSRDRPAIAAHLSVRDLRQGDTRIQQLRGDVNLDVGGASRSRLSVTGQGLSLGGQQWKSLRLDGAGTPATHELTAQLSGDPGNFQLALAGGLQQPAMLWQGRITQLTAKDTPVGHWALDQPATLRASAKDASLETACLSSAPSRLCLQGQWRQSGDFSGRAQLSQLDPERFKRFLPAGIALATRIDGEATASGKIGGALQAKLNANIAPGSVTTHAEGRPVRVAFNGGNVAVDANNRSAVAQARLDLAQTGQLQARLQVQDPLAAARLNGKVDAAITDLTLVKAFVPQITEISGQVRANVAIGGTASHPVVQGDVRLENAAVAIPEAGLQIKNIQFAAASAGQGPIQLKGSADSEPGQLQVAGQIDPAKMQLTLAVTGENFQALKSTNVQVQVSPDLKLDLTPQLARVEGEIAIPRAFVRPGGERAGMVNPSGDALIVRDRDGNVPEAKSGGMAIFADVRVVLGQEVLLETPAFKGKLRGDLRVVETPQLAPRGSGNIEVVAGKYKIYGEEIEIQRGQLLFSSSPLDNPALDLRVVRQERDIISGNEIMAGAQIRGTLKRPKLSFFATPTMSDPDTLSYLVLGRAPGGGGGESAMMFKAASALGAGQTGGITNSLSDAFGLDSAELGSSSGGGTSFMVGKYLTPRLYVGYGIGLLNAVNTFFLKYRFTKHLMLEAASNILGTGGDAVYTIER
ncbi:MAG: translocation/assembly module TamB domain-containing protein, partial [Candidatus Competibacter sp.]|nr:translocation/assembly module TamB domain-containing protein [Candidatus Competibacter sp.]